MKGFTGLVQPQITIQSYNPRSSRGQVISSVHEGLRAGEREAQCAGVSFSHIQLQFTDSLLSWLCFSLPRCMLGKASAGKWPVHLWEPIKSSSCCCDTDSEKEVRRELRLHSYSMFCPMNKSFQGVKGHPNVRSTCKLIVIEINVVYKM